MSSEKIIEFAEKKSKGNGFFTCTHKPSQKLRSLFLEKEREKDESDGKLERQKNIGPWKRKYKKKSTMDPRKRSIGYSNQNIKSYYNVTDMPIPKVNLHNSIICKKFVSGK